MKQSDRSNKGFRAFLLTQFLGALNDNAFKLIIGLLLVDRFADTPKATFYLSLSGILFVLPFLLFSTYSGFLADRFSKKKIIVIVKSVEMVIASIAVYGLSTSHEDILLLVMFLMGTHSAFFGPAKYGIIPELLPASAIPEANGVMVLLTYLGIILGKVAGGTLAQWGQNQMHIAGYALLLISCLGFFSSLFISSVKPSGSLRQLTLNPITEILANMRWISKERPIFLSIMGLTYFAFLGGLFELNILVYAKDMVMVDKLHTSYLLIALAIGIGLGSFLAGKLSDQKVELGLVPLGAIGISLFSMALGFTHYSYVLVCVNLFLLGRFSGFLIVPLNSLIQKDSPADKRGQIIATNNFLSFSGILLGSGFLFIFRQVFHLNPAQVFVVCGILTIMGTIYACRLLPYALVRLCVWILAHTIYKITVVDKERFPSKGGALIVANHISFIDAVLIVVSIQRPIRFIMSREIYHLWWLNALCRLGKAIPIDRKDNPKEIIRALHIAKQAIKDGEVVCIFPEGQLTRTGNTLKFNEGMQHIMKGLQAPIIPLHLDRIWGSIFSWKGGRFFWKWPKILPYPVTVSFGEAMSAQSTAFEVRNKVLELGAQAFVYRKADRLPLAEQFLRQARKQPLRFCLADSSRLQLNYALSAILSVCVAKQLRLPLKANHKIGVLLPPSVGGAVVNIALGLMNKVPVNINYTSSKEAIESIVKQCEMAYCISSRSFMEKSGIHLPCEIIWIDEMIKSISSFDKLKAAVTTFLFPIHWMRKIISGRWTSQNPDELATIMFTSGSTGEPKGVMLTHSNITSNLEGLYQVFEIEEKDKILGVLPFFHSFGFTGTLWFPLIAGIGSVYHYNPLDAKVIGKLFAEHQTTILMSTPTFLNSYIRRIEPKQLKSLRFVMVGAEKLKPQLAQEFQTKFGVLPMEGYGCTELSPIVSVNMPDFQNDTTLQKAHKPGSIGLPLPGIAVKIVDPDSRILLGVDQEGLLMVKGPNVMKGYLNAPDKTAQVIVDGWYQTGDVARMDEEGFITITDRLSRFSKIGGEMVPHIKIENKIHEILGVTEQCCVVTAVPDEAKGERLVALCLKQINRDELFEALRKCGLPNLWIPTRDMFVEVESFNLLGSGKLDLAMIKKRAIELTKT